MKKVTIAHRLEFATLLGVVGILKILPLPVASATMGALWRLVAPKLRRQKRAMGHLRQCFPEKSEEELYQITLAMWDNLGRTAAEGLLSQKFLSEAANHLELPDNITEVVDRMHAVGGVIVSLHSGNWELGGVVASAYGLDCSATIQRLSNPLAHAYMVRQRQATFRGGIFAKGDKAGMRIMSTIRGGSAAAIMGDLRDKRGVNVPFFGRSAPTNTFAAHMARQQDVPLVAVRVLRKGGIDFRLDLEVIDVSRTDDFDADVYDTTCKVQQVFERWIRTNPEQWMWAHKRWG